MHNKELIPFAQYLFSSLAK